jgi:hypothetical protein
MGLGISKETEQALADIATNTRRMVDLLAEILAELKSQKEKNHGG